MPIREDVVKASDFNEVVERYEKVWADTYNNTDTDPLDKTYGWGQTSVEPLIASEQLILAEDLNRLIAQVNAGITHTSSTEPLLNKLSAGKYEQDGTWSFGSPVLAENLIQVQDKIDWLSANRFDANESYLSPYMESHDVPVNLSWTFEITNIASFTFPTYNDARHFFNSGGSLCFDFALPEISYASPPGYEYWKNLFDNVGEICIKATEVITDGINDGISLGGFYNLTNGGSLATIWEAQGQAYAGAYGAYGGGLPYTGIGGGYGGYGQRAIKLAGKADYTPGGYTITLAITLVDAEWAQYDYIDTMIYPINLDVGYKQPVNAPTIADNQPNYTAGNYTYQFLDRTPPTITVTGWTGS